MALAVWIGDLGCAGGHRSQLPSQAQVRLLPFSPLFLVYQGRLLQHLLALPPPALPPQALTLTLQSPPVRTRGWAYRKDLECLTVCLCVMCTP